MPPRDMATRVWAAIRSAVDADFDPRIDGTGAENPDVEDGPPPRRRRNRRFGGVGNFGDVAELVKPP